MCSPLLKMGELDQAILSVWPGFLSQHWWQPCSSCQGLTSRRAFLHVASKLALTNPPAQPPWNCIMFVGRDGLWSNVGAHLRQTHGRPPGSKPWGLQAPRDTSCAGCLVRWLGFLLVGQGDPLGAHLEVHTLSSKPPGPKCRLLLLFI